MVYKIELSDGNILEISQNDLKSTKISCNELQKELIDGWRLPEIEELRQIFSRLHLNNVGNFKNEWYWSNTECYVSFDIKTQWCVNFQNGINNANGPIVHVLNEANIRLVRDLPKSI